MDKNFVNEIIIISNQPVYIKIAMSSDKKITRFLTYLFFIDDIVDRLTWRYRKINAELKTSNKKEHKFAKKNKQQGITPEFLSEKSNIPVSTVRADIAQYWDFFYALYCTDKPISFDIVV